MCALRSTGNQPHQARCSADQQCWKAQFGFNSQPTGNAGTFDLAAIPSSPAMLEELFRANSQPTPPAMLEGSIWGQISARLDLKLIFSPTAMLEGSIWVQFSAPSAHQQCWEAPFEANSQPTNNAGRFHLGPILSPQGAPFELMSQPTGNAGRHHLKLILNPGRLHLGPKTYSINIPLTFH